MLYNPPAFRADDVAGLLDDIDAIGFATLITVGETEPLVSQLPMLLDRASGPLGTLTGHIARANPQWRSSDLTKSAVALFAGPQAYVSPSLYPSKREHGRVVPTWNYALVHVRGRLSLFDDPAALAEHVAALTARHEAARAAPWSVADAPADFVERQLKGIVGVRLDIEAIEGKMKLSQNREPADRAGVAEGLAASDCPMAQATAALMRGMRQA